MYSFEVDNVGIRGVEGGLISNCSASTPCVVLSDPDAVKVVVMLVPDSVFSLICLSKSSHDALRVSGGVLGNSFGAFRSTKDRILFHASTVAGGNAPSPVPELESISSGGALAAIKPFSRDHGSASTGPTAGVGVRFTGVASPSDAEVGTIEPGIGVV